MNADRLAGVTAVELAGKNRRAGDINFCVFERLGQPLAKRVPLRDGFHAFKLPTGIVTISCYYFLLIVAFAKLAIRAVSDTHKFEMKNFDKRMALDVIEDALTDMDTPHKRGMATGLCGAFHMCGLLSAEEWEALLQRIPVEPCKARVGGIHGIKSSGARVHSRVLN